MSKPFMVIATQNPIEHEGTYRLPEAQLDRFMLKIVIGYPSKEEERMIIRQNLSADGVHINPVVTNNQPLNIWLIREPFIPVPLDKS